MEPLTSTEEAFIRKLKALAADEAVQPRKRPAPDADAVQPRKRPALEASPSGAAKDSTPVASTQQSVTPFNMPLFPNTQPMLLSDLQLCDEVRRVASSCLGKGGDERLDELCLERDLRGLTQRSLAMLEMDPRLLSFAEIEAEFTRIEDAVPHLGWSAHWLKLREKELRRELRRRNEARFAQLEDLLHEQQTQIASLETRLAECLEELRDQSNSSSPTF